MQQTVLEMHLPAFRQGYQAGRARYFSGRVHPLTDKIVLDRLYELTQDGAFAEARMPMETQWTVGELFGEISGAVIAMQEDEWAPDERQERLLAELAQALPREQDTDQLIASIRQMWQTQDQLAGLLDEDLYERVRQRDAAPVFKRTMDT